MEYTLNGVKYTAKRYKLREWLKLDAVRERLLDAIENKDTDRVAKFLCDFVSIASDLANLDALPWYEIAKAFLAIEAENQLHHKFALLRTTRKRIDVPPWDYDGRSWYWWNNILSSKYGWTSEYVAELDIDDATGLLQEILVDEQLRKEWEWSLTELAYPYDEVAKKGRFKPLDRPDWMKTILPDQQPKIPVMRIRKDMLPVGIVVKGKSNETPLNQ